MTRVLVTGGAGFIGSHYVRTMLTGGYAGYEDAEVTVFDKLTYAGNPANLAPVADSPRYRFVQGDICRAADLEAMWSKGLALGGTPLNAVVVDGERVMTPGGWRHEDEAVRHKMLDAVGDLALAGGPLLARYTGNRAGHAMTNRLLRALFATEGAWEWTTCTAEVEGQLPGAGIIAQRAAAPVAARARAVA